MNPKTIILTNIEPDHLDYYKNLENIVKAFQEYINKLPEDGLLIINNDDKNIKKLIKPNCKVITYGIENQADLMAQKVRTQNNEQTFELEYKGNHLGEFKINIPGKFNIYNVLAAASLALSLGVKSEIIKETIKDFKGSWRRFEILGDYKGALVVSDYAHHPTAISQTLQAAKEFYPNKRIVLAFHPHHPHRTKSLFNDFIESFDDADLLILNEIYHVAGRDDVLEDKISSMDLVDATKKKDEEKGINRVVLFGKDLKQTKELILDNIKEGDLLIVMGAGDLYLVAEELFA